MGTMQHKAMVVTGIDHGENKLTKAYKKARKLFPKQLVSKRLPALTNGYESFLIAPSGSKVGWNPDVDHETAMKEFVEYLETLKYSDGSTSVKYVYLTFGELGLTIEDYMGHDFQKGIGRQ